MKSFHSRARMSISVVYSILLLVSLPALNLGLLSDYKICGDLECESLMSRVQAIRDYHGRDCRFLSFRKGDTIFVYHKLTGKREDLWAGTIDKQFGYFAKDAVRVEDVHTTTEKVVATQDSDFFCMDEFGYIIDSHHLDGVDDDEKSPSQELETFHSEGSNIEGLSVSETTDSPIPVHENKLTEEIQDAAIKEAEAKETPQEEPNMEGGSASAPWLGSSVTGWFGLNSGEEPDKLDEVKKKDENKETADGATLASSVTGWLGWGEGREAEESVKSKEQDLDTANSFTSSMTGWLGFEAKTEQLVDKEQSDGEGGSLEEEEPAERFRSRKMSLELESSQSEEEDKGEMGTLEWLGAGLTNQLSFGRTVQEIVTPVSEETGGENEEEKQQTSWFQVGIGNILGYERDADRGMGSDLRDTNTEESKLEETLEDKKVSFESDISEEVVANGEYSQESAVDKGRISVEGEDTQSSVGSGISSVLNSFFPAGSEENEEHNLLNNEKMELNLQEDTRVTEQHLVENINKYSKKLEREEEDEIKPHTSETDQAFLTHLRVDLPSDPNFVDLNIKSTEQLTDKGVRMEKLDEIHHQTDYTSNELSAVENNKEREDFQIDNSTTLQQARELAEESKFNDPVLETTEGISEEQNSPAGLGGQTSIDHFGSVTLTETEENQEESVDVGKVEESTQGYEQSQSTAQNTTSDNVLEPGGGTSHTNEGTTTPEDDAGEDLSSLILRAGDGDANVSEKSDKQLPAQTETEEQEQGAFHSTLSSENETNEMKEHRKKEEEHAPAQPQVIEEDKQEEKDTNLREKETFKGLKEGAAKGQQEPSGETTVAVEETIIAQRQEEERVLEEMHIEKKGKRNEVEEIEDKVGLKAEEEVIKEEKLEEKTVNKEKLWQIHGLQKEREKEVVELQEGEDTGIAKEEKEEQEPLKELKDGKYTDRKQLHNNLKEEIDEELKGEDRSKASTDERQTRVKSVETKEIETVVGSKTNEIQEVVTEVIDVLNREFNELKDEGNHQDFKEKENQHELKEEENQQELEEEDEAAVPGDVDVQKNVDGAQGQSQEQDILESASEQTDRIKSKNDQGSTEEEAGNMNGDGVFPEKEEVEKNMEGTRQEEALEQQQGGLFSPSEYEQNTRESAEQGPLTAGDQVLMVKTEESVGTESGEEQTNDIAETDEKTTSQWHLAGDRNVKSSTSIPEPDAGVLGSAVDINVTGFSGGVNTSSEGNIHQNQDKKQSDPGTFTREKMEHTDDNSAMNQSVNNDSKSIDATGSSHSSAESQVATHDHTASQNPPPASSMMSDGHGKGAEASQTGKAFGLFNSAFSFFRETESASTLSDLDKSEESEAEASQTPDQEPEPLPDLPVVTSQSLFAEPETHQPAIPSGSPVEPEIPQPATSSVLQSQQSSASANTGKPLQSKTFSKDYRTLLAHVGEADLALLVGLFGRHKLQFLDYILGVSEPAAEERDHDESILTDIETLLDYHMGGQAPPSARLDGSPQDELKAGALQKLQDLLTKVRQSFNRGNSGDSDTNHKDKAEPGCVGQSCLSKSKDEGITADAESGPVVQGSANLDGSGPIGIMRQVQDFAHDLTVHVHAVGELLIWLSVQV